MYISAQRDARFSVQQSLSPRRNFQLNRCCLVVGAHEQYHRRTITSPRHSRRPGGTSVQFSRCCSINAQQYRKTIMSRHTAALRDPLYISPHFYTPAGSAGNIRHQCWSGRLESLSHHRSLFSYCYTTATTTSSSSSSSDQEEDHGTYGTSFFVYGFYQPQEPLENLSGYEVALPDNSNINSVSSSSSSSSRRRRRTAARAFSGEGDFAKVSASYNASYTLPTRPVRSCVLNVFKTYTFYCPSHC